MAALFVLAFIVIASVAVAFGRTPDTRDSDYSLGKVIAPRTASNAGSR
ncbi:MAG TPA: hypothetical protein VE442_00700 [Jatrophihabitans sp.]|jgi:hypothetical protein|nr:hypothetical protein [Jatrophihabitans sp.]